MADQVFEAAYDMLVDQGFGPILDGGAPIRSKILILLV